MAPEDTTHTEEQYPDSDKPAPEPAKGQDLFGEACQLAGEDHGEDHRKRITNDPPNVPSSRITEAEIAALWARIGVYDLEIPYSRTTDDEAKSRETAPTTPKPPNKKVEALWAEVERSQPRAATTEAAAAEAGSRSFPIEESDEDNPPSALAKIFFDLLGRLKLLKLPKIKFPSISFPEISTTRLAILASALAIITTMEGSSNPSTFTQKSNKPVPTVPAKTTPPPQPQAQPQERITPDETITLDKEQFLQAKQIAKGLNAGFYPKAKIGNSYCTKANILNDKEIIFILEDGKTLLVTY